MMFIFLITQDKNDGYDTFDSAIVYAESEEHARIMNPSGYYIWDGVSWCWGIDGERWGDDSWCLPKDVNVEMIGQAVDPVEPGVILASFNAG